MDELLEYFPQEFKPMQQQIDLITQIDNAFKEGYKFVICCAPTGSGKSFISKTLANYSKQTSEKFKKLIDTNNAFEIDTVGDYTKKEECDKEPAFGTFALTITKSLQDQYTNLFQDSYSLKGKSNYICNVDNRYDVEIAPCLFNPKLKSGCILNDTCHYYKSRKDMLTSKFGVLNYSMFLSLPEHVKRKEYLVCDEASEIEDELVKRFSRMLPYKFLKKLGYDPNTVPLTYKKFKIWLDSFVMMLGDEVTELRKSMTKKHGKKEFDSEAQKFKLFSNMYNQLKTTIDTWKKCEYLIETTIDGIFLKPLRVDNLSKELFDYGEKVVLMSATIIDPENFAKTLGIEEYKYIEVDSFFDPKKAPIYATRGNKINYKNLKEKLPSISKQISDICKAHKNEKGIIHTHTHEITQYLKDNLEDTSRFLFRLDGSENETILKEHIESTEPTVLVSPSMSYGVDLKGDLAKFQIIVKASYMPLNDERVKRLFNEDKEWYVNKMLNNLIQACGRGVRSRNDECVTYILDGNISDAVIRNSSKLPKYFLARFA